MVRNFNEICQDAYENADVVGRFPAAYDRYDPDDPDQRHKVYAHKAAPDDDDADHVDDEDETVTNKFEHFSTLLSKKHGSVDYWGDITDERINEADDTIADIVDGVDDEVSEQTETIQE